MNTEENLSLQIYQHLWSQQFPKGFLITRNGKIYLFETGENAQIYLEKIVTTGGTWKEIWCWRNEERGYIFRNFQSAYHWIVETLKEAGIGQGKSLHAQITL